MKKETTHTCKGVGRYVKIYETYCMESCYAFILILIKDSER